MISTVAFCPHPPLLIPELAQGAAGELDDLRAACRTAIARIATPSRRIALLGTGPSSATYGAGARGSLGAYGLNLDVTLGSEGGNSWPALPLSLTVGAWLVGDALGPDPRVVGYSLATGDVPDELAELAAGTDDTALLVMGDASARRSLKAPGYLDERAAPFDRSVLAALASGRPEALAALDPVLGAELLAPGVAVWRAVGTLLAGTRWSAEVLYAAAPYGVEYPVAIWTGRG